MLWTTWIWIYDLEHWRYWEAPIVNSFLLLLAPDQPQSFVPDGSGCSSLHDATIYGKLPGWPTPRVYSPSGDHSDTPASAGCSKHASIDGGTPDFHIECAVTAACPNRPLQAWQERWVWRGSQLRRRGLFSYLDSTCELGPADPPRRNRPRCPRCKFAVRQCAGVVVVKGLRALGFEKKISCTALKMCLVTKSCNDKTSERTTPARTSAESRTLAWSLTILTGCCLEDQRQIQEHTQRSRATLLSFHFWEWILVPLPWVQLPRRVALLDRTRSLQDVHVFLRCRDSAIRLYPPIDPTLPTSEPCPVSYGGSKHLSRYERSSWIRASDENIVLRT